MKSWFPEKDEKWVFKVEIETTRENAGSKFIIYKPLYMQQAGARRELEESVFTNVFLQGDGSNKIPSAGGIWLLNVIVKSVDKNALTVDYSHVGMDGVPVGDDRRMSLHVFRASFRRLETPNKVADSFADRSCWQSAHSIPKRGGWYMMSVQVLEAIENEGKQLVKYKAIENEQGSAPRLLEDKVFRSVFEPIDGAVSEIRTKDEWFMMVEITDYDPEEFSVWYRPISSSGEHKGAIRQLSDYIFLATFKPAR